MITTSEWRARGHFVETTDGRIFVVDTGPTKAEIPLVLLHGFPTSCWDFAPLLELLSAQRRVITFDFLGFGLSDKPSTLGYSLFEQADAAIAVLRALGVERTHVVAHDMGTSVATELCARRERSLLPFVMDSLVLMNGSVHVELAQLTVGQQLLRSPLGGLFVKLNNARTFKAQMRRIFARAPREEELDAMWELLSRDEGTQRLPQTIHYIEERRRFRRRWIGALERLDLPTLIAWGRKDPVAVMAIAEQLAREIPGARLETWDELGHYPQVEDPQRVAATLAAFHQSLGARG